MGEGGDCGVLINFRHRIKESIAEVPSLTNLKGIGSTAGNNGILGQLSKGPDRDEVVPGTTPDVEGRGAVHSLSDRVSAVGSEDPGESGVLGGRVERHGNTGAKGDGSSCGKKCVRKGVVVCSAGRENECVCLVPLEGIQGEGRGRQGENIGLGATDEGERSIHSLNKGVGTLGIANHR